jgi:di/tricarboxylate transporter
MVMAAGGYRTKDFAKFGAPFHVSTIQIWLFICAIPIRV